MALLAISGCMSRGVYQPRPNAPTLPPTRLEEIAVFPQPDSVSGDYIVLGTVNRREVASGAAQTEMYRQAFRWAQEVGGNAVILLNVSGPSSPSSYRGALGLNIESSSQVWIASVEDPEVVQAALYTAPPGLGPDDTVAEVPDWTQWVGITGTGAVVRPVEECESWQGRSVHDLTLFRNLEDARAALYKLTTDPACR